MSLEFTLRYLSRCEKRQILGEEEWPDQEMEEICLGAIYSMWCSCGSRDAAQKPAERCVNSQEHAERNVLVYELLLLWQVFNPGFQKNVRAGSLNTPVSDGT